MKKFIHPSFKRPMQKHLFARKRRWDTGSREVAAANRDLDEDVGKWWHGCQVSGELVSDNEAYTAGIDYKGALPWPEAVSIRVLFNEFLMTTEQSCSKMQFWQRLSYYTKPINVGTTSYREVHMGRDMGRKHQQMYFLDRGLTEV